MADGDRTRKLSFSSEKTVVQRWFGGEILDHSPKSIRSAFIKSGRAPLLLNHDTRQQVGVVTDTTFGNDKVGRSIVRFGRSALAEQALQDVDDGILVNTSVGYRVHEMVLDRQGKDGDTYRVTDWEPYEETLCAVPADAAVGVGRDGDTPDDAGPPGADATNSNHEPRSERGSSFSAPAERTENAMTDQVRAAAGTSAEDKNAAAVAAAAGKSPSALEFEGQRRKAIESLAKASNIQDQIRDMWISSGASIESVSEDILRIVEERGKSNPKSVARLGLGNGEVRQFSVLGAIRAIADKDWSKAGFEAECSREIANRLGKQPDPNKFFIPLEVQERAAISRRQLAIRDALAGDPRYGQRTADTVAVAAQGGYLVDTVNQSFIEILRNRTVAYALGARRLGGLVGNITIPRQTGAATASWMTSESTQIAASNQTFGQLAMTPKTVGGYTEISRLLLLQSSPDAEGIVNADLAAVTGIALDAGIINGTGANGAPVGIINTPGVSAQGSQATFAFANLLAFQSALAGANVRPTSGGYATTPTVSALAMARVKFANTATPLWDGNVWDASGADGCCGYPGLASVQIPAGNIIFGDWAQILIGEWGVLEVEVNPYANFQAGIIGVRTLLTCDVALRYPQAFAFGTGAT